jgi:uncharacterized protein (DUF488 family)
MPTDSTMFSVGHSGHSSERFEELLKSAQITAIADVRSVPFSRRTPHFNSTELKHWLREVDIAYSFLGRELGGRPRSPQLYCEGIADYEKMAQVPAFKNGIQRLLEGTRKYRIALLCSEHDPIDCHRCLLVGRELVHRDVEVQHVLSDGSFQSQHVIEGRLLKLTGRPNDDLFSAREELLAAAYREHSRRVAFAEPQRISTINAAE